MKIKELLEDLNRYDPENNVIFTTDFEHQSEETNFTKVEFERHGNDVYGNLSTPLTLEEARKKKNCEI